MQKRYGYVRVSTKEQNVDRQIVAMLDAKIKADNIFIDKQSGKDFNRAAYQKLLDVLEEGDILYIKSIDRLGRNYTEIMNQWRILTKEKGVDLVVMDMPLLDTRYGKDLLGTFLSDLVLQVLSFVAENGRETIRSNQAEGIAAAKKKGVKFGRPRLLPTEEFERQYVELKAQGCTNREMMRLMSFSYTSFYRYQRAMWEKMEERTKK